FDSCRDRAVAGDDNDRECLVDRAKSIEDFYAVHARHLDVEDDQIGRLAFGQRETFLTGRGGDVVVPLVLEGHSQRIADRGFVVDDENAGFGHQVGGQRSSTRTVFSWRCGRSGTNTYSDRTSPGLAARAMRLTSAIDAMR